MIRRLAYACAIAVALVPALSSPALAEPASWSPTLPPHVASSPAPDTCAMCHRNHTSASDATWDRGDERRSALLAGRPGREDIEVCYVCHGLEALGSTREVEASFLASSTHRIAPAPSAFGATKYCSSCHDAHGEARIASGVPYPALLRSKGSTGGIVYQGDEVCAGCHPVRPASRFDGYAVWKKSPHAALPEPASGTRIVCGNCHEPHGSRIAPLLSTEITLTPPAVPATSAVTGDNRTQCSGCHAASSATWSGAITYATGGHASSASTAVIAAEWAPAGADRLVGECQNCHSPMGSSDGSGGVIANLLEKSGRALCDDCHKPSGPTGAADLSSLKYTVAGTPTELVASVVPDVPVSTNGRLEVWVRDVPGVTGLVGPRTYVPTALAGPVVATDLDADGANEIVAADGSAASLSVMTDDELAGLRVVDTAALTASAVALAAGNIVPSNAGPEVVAAVGDRVVVLGWSAGVLGVLRTSPALAGPVTSVAAGDLDADGDADIVAVVQSTEQFFILSEDSGSLLVSAGHDTLRVPVAASIADVHPAGGVEIVIANGGENRFTVSYFAADGSSVQDVDNTLPSPPAIPTALSTGEVLSAFAGDETVMSWAHVDGEAGFDVFAQQGGAVVPVARVAIGLRSNPRSVAVGDLDADGRPEVVLGNSGLFTDRPERTLPTIEIHESDAAGTGFDAPVSLPLGGIESAGGVIHVAVADIGRVGPSRHPVDAALTHESTEALGASRHVTCSDCHNTHESTQTVNSAPMSPGAMKGAWGAQTSVSGGAIVATMRGAVSREYEVCLTCHATWAGSTGEGALDSLIATAGDTDTTSFHPVAGDARTTNADFGTLVPGSDWENGRWTYCVDCHSNAQAAEADGPHRSTAAPLLVSSYGGMTPDDGDGLCYDCHRHDVYGQAVPLGVDGNVGTSSGFVDAVRGPQHAAHTSTRAVSCSACHVSHGSATNAFLLRDDIGWDGSARTGVGGSCTNGCHGGAPNGYVRP